MSNMDFTKYQVAQNYVDDFRKQARKNATAYIENGNTIVGFVKVDAYEEVDLGVFLTLPEKIVERNGFVFVDVTLISDPAVRTTVKVPLDVILGKAK